MNLLELYKALNKASLELEPGLSLSDTEVLLHYEQSAMEDGFSRKSSEGISDIRLVDDWALPGESLVVNEGIKPKKLVIFYENHFKLDSSTES